MYTDFSIYTARTPRLIPEISSLITEIKQKYIEWCQAQGEQIDEQLINAAFESSFGKLLKLDITREKDNYEEAFGRYMVEIGRLKLKIDINILNVYFTLYDTSLPQESRDLTTVTQWLPDAYNAFPH